MQQYNKFNKVTKHKIYMKKCRIIHSKTINLKYPVRHGIQNLSYLRQGQVNLLVYGPDQPYFKQKQKNITKF